MAGFANVMPLRIEDEMKKIGASYIRAGLWRGFGYRDGNVLTAKTFPALRSWSIVVRR